MAEGYCSSAPLLKCGSRHNKKGPYSHLQIPCLLPIIWGECGLLQYKGGLQFSMPQAGRLVHTVSQEVRLKFSVELEEEQGGRSMLFVEQEGRLMSSAG